MITLWIQRRDLKSQEQQIREISRNLEGQGKALQHSAEIQEKVKEFIAKQSQLLEQSAKVNAISACIAHYREEMALKLDISKDYVNDPNFQLLKIATEQWCRDLREEMKKYGLEDRVEWAKPQTKK